MVQVWWIVCPNHQSCSRRLITSMRDSQWRLKLVSGNLKQTLQVGRVLHHHCNKHKQQQQQQQAANNNHLLILIPVDQQ